MKRAFFFKTKDEKFEMTIRGARGSHVMDYLRNEKCTSRILEGMFVTTIITTFDTLKELETKIGEMDL